MLKFIDYSGFFNNTQLTAVISKRDENYALKKNKDDFIISLGIDSEKVIFPQQVHSNNVKVVNEAKIYGQTDGLISTIENVGVGILVADCVPIYLFGLKNRHCGLIHSGWKGTAKEITTNAIKIFIELGNTLSDIKVLLGPSIGKCCFEVGSDVSKYFSQKNLISLSGLKFKLDLKSEICSELLNAGLDIKNIHIDDQCTYCKNNKFFSYRREGIDSGRMVALMI